jgi:16S rRNA (cytidine1402-2'-O)-methyltransferase
MWWPFKPVVPNHPSKFLKMPSNSPIHEHKAAVSAGALYVVATPIGNLEDITLRALRILAEVDLVAAEDTRQSGKLLAHHGLKKPMIAYHEHNERQRAPALIERLQLGQAIALLTDAGTPAISDPGYRLIAAAVELGLKVIPIPGPSAVTTALSAAGLPTDAFYFVGFLPSKQGKRQTRLDQLKHIPATLVIYEAARRIDRLLKELDKTLGNRYIVIGRELTKRHEEFIRGSTDEVRQAIRRREALKGECTVLVARDDNETAIDATQLQALLRHELQANPAGMAQISRRVAQQLGLSRNRVYQEALKLAQSSPTENRNE